MFFLKKAQLLDEKMMECLEIQKSNEGFINNFIDKFSLPVSESGIRMLQEKQNSFGELIKKTTIIVKKKLEKLKPLTDYLEKSTESISVIDEKHNPNFSSFLKKEDFEMIKDAQLFQEAPCESVLNIAEKESNYSSQKHLNSEFHIAECVTEKVDNSIVSDFSDKLMEMRQNISTNFGEANMHNKTLSEAEIKSIMSITEYENEELPLLDCHSRSLDELTASLEEWSKIPEMLNSHLEHLQEVKNLISDHNLGILKSEYERRQKVDEMLSSYFKENDEHAESLFAFELLQRIKFYRTYFRGESSNTINLEILNSICPRFNEPPKCLCFDITNKYKVLFEKE
eukprot:MONOS_488.1-p1 / transcript=MONOS_488.1 / gene=MONOS_488 / organism=Monocercomonoides_exilis_PA203 / gene_product=unspecified product / transcript_product=unspecified product / location=Mono_scaffold00008:4149-5897(-) / protein_length=340 / sequence_SO=supercontig / SO=protein_coding / is_pseudo=false